LDVLTAKPLSALRAAPLRGRIRVPGDKSISHRALIFGALATGTTRVRGLLEAEDVINTARAVTALGAIAEKRGDVWEIKGRGPGGLRQPTEALDFGNSGTGARLMMGVIAGHPITVEMTGDASLSRRPMRRVLGPLMQMGLQVLEPGKETLPMTLRGTSELIPLVYPLPVPSAQVKSAVLLAGLHAAGETTVIEHEATRDHTERMLRHFGASLSVEDGEPVADLSVRASKLHGVEVPAERAPRMIDAYPIHADPAAFARGRPVMRGLAELRVTESDRLGAIAEGLAACGAEAAIEDDTLVVLGRGAPPAGGAEIAARLDHRIAMAFLVLGLAAARPVRIDDGATIATSFPGFVPLMNGLGATIAEEPS
jgi:5-enolpyruvylshikimate-3-phosphate synthase